MAYRLRLFRRVLGSVVLFFVVVAQALAADITAVRSWRAPDNTRLVFDLSAPVTWQISPDSTPARLIVDIDGARPVGPLALPAVQSPLKGVRLEATAKGQRLVIDTALELLPRIFQLPPNEKYGHRLVLDLYEKSVPRPVNTDKTATAGTGSVVVASPAVEPGKGTADAVARLPAAGSKGSEKGSAPSGVPAPTASAPVPVAPPAVNVPAPTGPELAGEKSGRPEKPEKSADHGTAAAKGGDTPREGAGPEKRDSRRYRNIIVAIDAGHGGEDPGAIGQNGTHEKDVTLAIARTLRDRLDAEPGITAVLTRTGDYFIPLQDRRRIARYQHKADIFVSIHADSAPSAAARGASVFALSLKGADTATSRFARMLAERENRADLIGGAAIETEDNVLRNVLADMVVAGSLDHSLHMGRNIIQGLEHVGNLHSHRVEQAGFAVLKEPGMVSLLVETGFISNPDEEKKLTSRQYQQDIAGAVSAGVVRYCQQYPAPSTYFAWRADHGRVAAADKSAGRPDRDADTPGDAPPSTGQDASVKPAADAASAKEKPAGPDGGAVKSGAVSRSGGPVAEAPPAPVVSRKEKAADRKVVARFRSHRVEPGESLTRLSDRYGVSMASLRQANRLQDDTLRIGQTLKIPVN
ncbi:MAG TPA: N-acetylmuramoyl-L-alanine amidase [Moraxellaceae bacterium]|nr:N-acetylmuramoyl-L-alanine amidase [Moraxellaceae bacterium]